MAALNFNMLSIILFTIMFRFACRHSRLPNFKSPVNFIIDTAINTCKECYTPVYVPQQIRYINIYNFDMLKQQM